MIQVIDSMLSQWDVGRIIKVTNTNATHIHLANQGDSKAVIMELENSQALIPNYLLQTGKTLLAYAVVNGVTIESKSFVVQKRERPENYVYDDDRRNYIYELISDAEEAVENANLAAQNANEAADKAKEYIDSTTSASARLTSIVLPASAWKTEAENLHSQVVAVAGATPYSKVDLLPSVEQLAIFHNKDVAFVTENENSVITVYAIGDKPLLDYTMQAQITEVTV